ncbi:hypothetical protein HBI56_102640 [Parastagonospora nodorum]|uniref:Uncharacterized protein n=1 Tax=Phaeosphaeria nodorum (strain SN15 / ATCC MYA-4574 / FGSC 10173) TaxID=321614 RepID=A0A7U2FC17_PHANO|nr:hypothetical protein HBH54_157070 [Parastagonospora nodorum]QRD02519.1 hypothetical protein JI435_441030 [Parastagonospora nodorum SN15]KAH3974830.1 hypothetical protein HBH52_130390 [Parastagonospora nodorum]KAH4066632.1 hypothetical protein HBH50_141070 [Parastagonospora nodorum]KAH4105168.1 hypothetical protein HBH46_085540 [Parastagonospora nodorum]
MLAASSDVWRLKTQRLRETWRSKTFKGRAFADCSPLAEILQPELHNLKTPLFGLAVAAFNLF